MATIRWWPPRAVAPNRAPVYCVWISSSGPCDQIVEMELITAPKLMPPLHSRAATGVAAERADAHVATVRITTRRAVTLPPAA